MRLSTKLSNLVAKHLSGQVKSDTLKEFNLIIIEMRKTESTIGCAFERLEELHDMNKIEAN